MGTLARQQGSNCAVQALPVLATGVVAPSGFHTEQHPSEHNLEIHCHSRSTGGGQGAELNRRIRGQLPRTKKQAQLCTWAPAASAALRIQMWTDLLMTNSNGSLSLAPDLKAF